MKLATVANIWEDGRVTIFVPEPRDGTAGHAHERVAEQLRSAMLSQVIAPGSKLPAENDLAEAFKVSRATVREALRSLTAENLIETRRGVTGGSFVAEPSLERMSERLQVGLALLTSSSALSLDHFMEVRSFLEIPACGVAAIRRTDEELDRLLKATDPVEQSLADRELYHYNRDFHFQILEICHNPLLRLAAEPIFLVLQTCLDRSKLGVKFHRAVRRHHRDIASAFEAEDAVAAEELMADHLTWLESYYRKVWQLPESGTARHGQDASEGD
jgi:DNA-binding FadR family transcriptional regulator